MRKILTTALLAAFAALLIAPATSHAQFDVRDHLSEVDFPLETDIVVSWNDEQDELTATYPDGHGGEIELLVQTELNRVGDLQFKLEPPVYRSANMLAEGFLESEGTISLLPSGEPTMEIDTTFVGGISAEEVSIYTIETADGAEIVNVAAVKSCDCTTISDLSCETHHCNDGDTCPNSVDETCVWSDDSFFLIASR